MGIDPTKNIAMANKMRRDCPAGYKKRYLSPKDKCSDQFTIGTGKSVDLIPHFKSTALKIYYDFVYRIV